MEKISLVPIGNFFFGGPHFLQNLTGVGYLVSILLANALVVAGVILLFLIITSGITMISAGGDPEKFEKANKIITAAVVGFILIIGAYFIVRLLERSLSMNIIS